MRNLLCVIGRHEWQIKYDTQGGRSRCAADPSVITFEMTTLHRTAHTPAAIEAPHLRTDNHPNSGWCAFWRWGCAFWRWGFERLFLRRCEGDWLA